MAKGLCSKCGISLQSGNCIPAVLKSGYGYCRACNTKHRLTTHDRNPEKFKYTILKSTAKKQDRAVEITLQEYTHLVKDKSCLYCGGSLSICIFGYGLDRTDHTKGYIIDNCVPCCWSCNTRKGRLEQLGFPPNRSIELLHEVNQIRKYSEI